MARIVNIQVRRDTAANWTATNPTLSAGEIGFESDTNKAKIGDGATAWATLPYLFGSTFLALTGGTLTGNIAFAGAQTVDGRDVSADGTKLDNLVTLSGVAANAADLGTFTGTTIPDSSTVKAALQSIETALELVPTRKQSVVADIAARNALVSPATGDIAYVADATADATVASGGAMYIYSAGSWVKVAEFESMDLTAVSTFLALTDTPSAFTGAGGQFVKVNSGATALEFSNVIDGGSA